MDVYLHNFKNPNIKAQKVKKKPFFLISYDLLVHIFTNIRVLLDHLKETGRNPQNINYHSISRFRFRDIMICILKRTVRNHHLSTFLKYRPRKNSQLSDSVSWLA